jgi:hypothetical protein
MKRYEAAVAAIRQQGPMTIPELASVMRWSEAAAAHAVFRARFHLLLIRIEKKHSGHFVFGAVQTIGEMT